MLPNALYAQEKGELSRLVNDNKEEVYALSLYPVEIRESILETTLHPEILVKLKAIQNNTSDSFKKLLQYAQEEDQKKYWELTKYDDLIHKLVNGGQKSPDEIRNILHDYPEEIHETALIYGTQRYRTLDQMEAIQQEANAATELLLKSYPPKTQTAVHKLLDFPEVLYLLGENLDLVVLVGDAYAKDPLRVNRKADSIQAIASKEYTEEIKEWEKGLADDPNAMKEFEEASSAFTNENGYKDYDPLYPGSEAPPKAEKEGKQTEEKHIDVYYHYHYPYWFGYPYWYPTAYWYWYPYWYHWGYYYGYDRTVLIVGLPSYYFISWYFSVPYHHYLYPHFSDYVIRYYRRSVSGGRSGLYTAVNEWESQNRNPVTRTILADDNRRVERLKEYGRFETDYQKRVSRSPSTVKNRETYLNENRKRYPNLTGNVRNTIKSTERVQERTIRRSTVPSRVYQMDRANDALQRTWQRSEYNNRYRTPTPQRATPTQRKPTKRRGDD